MSKPKLSRKRYFCSALTLLGTTVFGAEFVLAATEFATSGTLEGVDSDTTTNTGWYIVGVMTVVLIGVSAIFYRSVSTMKYSTKLSLLVGVLLSVSTTISFVAIYDMKSIGEKLTEVAQEDIPLSNKIAAIAIHQLEQALWLERAALAGASNDAARLQHAIAEFQRLADQVDREIQHAEDISEHGIENVNNLAAQNEYRKVLSALQRIDREHRAFDGHADSFFKMIRGGRIEESQTLLRDIEAEIDELDHDLVALEEKVVSFTLSAARQAERFEQNSLRTIIALSILGLLFAIGLSTFVIKNLLAQLGADPNRLMAVAGYLADGKFAQEYEDARSGVYFSIATTMRKMKDVLGRIQTASNVVTQASEEVSQGNTNLSQRTQEQASNLEEVAASMEEMTATVNQNAQNAQQASELASTTKSQAVNGGDIVNQSITAMEEINKSSRKIADIIGVIDDMAFQTNLLALNAAVEAARAGEQGRGFAVVASEVRNLAGRSATAAKEIKELIDDSVSKVDEGSRLVTNSGEALTEIVESVRQVSNIVAEIAAASQEQSSGIGQVNTAVTQMDEMTQESAALVEESAAAAEALGAEAEALRIAIDFFELDEENVNQDRGSIRTQEAVEQPVSQSRNWQPTPALAFDSGNTDSDWREF